MADAEHVRIVKEGQRAIVRWHRDNPNSSLDLSGADLANCRLDQRQFLNSDMTNADLKNSTFISTALDHCVMDGANCSDSVFSSTRIIGSQIREAVLDRTFCAGTLFYGTWLDRSTFRKAMIRNAHFCDSRLAGARFDGSDLAETTFSRIDLSAVAGLAKIKHLGPSTIGLDTLLFSRGMIPDAFLRGCGYDPAIQRVFHGSSGSRDDAYYELARGERAMLQTGFISFTARDPRTGRFAARLERALNQISRGSQFYASRHGTWGQGLKEQLQHQIMLRERFLLVCSAASLNDAEWVEWELDWAIEKSKATKSNIIFPIMIDNALETWNDPRRKFILANLAADFRGALSGPAFDKAVIRLVDSMKIEIADQKPSTTLPAIQFPMK